MINLEQDKISFTSTAQKRFILISLIFIIIYVLALASVIDSSLRINIKKDYILYINSLIIIFIFCSTILWGIAGLIFPCLIIFIAITLCAFQSEYYELFILYIFIFLTAITAYSLLSKLNKKQLTENINRKLILVKCNLIKNDIKSLISKKSALEKKIKIYTNLNDAAVAFSKTLDFNNTIETILKKCISNIPEGNCLIYLINSENTNSYSNYKTTYNNSKKNAILPDFFDECVINYKHPIYIKNLKTDFRFKAVEKTKRKLNSIVIVPLTLNDKVIGTLRIDSHKPNIYKNNDLRILNYISFSAVIAIRNAKLYEQTNNLAQTDSLTKLYKRWYFFEELENEFNRAHRYNKTFSIILLDIDHFKKLNDTYGHSAGDKVLIKLSSIIKNNISDIDIAGRYGGEEIILLLPNADNSKANSLAQKLKEYIKERCKFPEIKNVITVSGGIATYPKDGASTHELIKNADEKLYRAKNTGRDKIIC